LSNQSNASTTPFDACSSVGELFVFFEFNKIEHDPQVAAAIKDIDNANTSLQKAIENSKKLLGNK
jgi:hypothetical protein